MKEHEELAAAARAAAAHSYSPFSGYPVGAAVQCENGKMFTGTNVENSSYGLTICAERVAMARAVSAGCRELKAVAIYAARAREVASCCGACRQFLLEFASDPAAVPVVLTGQGASRETPLDEQLPGGFRLPQPGLAGDPGQE